MTDGRDAGAPAPDAPAPDAPFDAVPDAAALAAAATADQVAASAPGASVWVSANAGSGKTSVLTRRVARLLLGH